jgi:hypothetical protein
MTRRHLAYAAIVAVGLAAGFGGRIAWSAIPDGNTIHACYKNDTGVLRVIDPSAGGTCNAKSETALSWAQTGAQGIQGDQGPSGLQGSTGSAGIDGVSNYQIVSGSATTAFDSFWQQGAATAGATCPSGTVATGVGFDLPTTKVSPFSIGGDEGELLVLGDTGVTVTAYTVCVDQQFQGK